MDFLRENRFLKKNVEKETDKMELARLGVATRCLNHFSGHEVATTLPKDPRNGSSKEKVLTRIVYL